MTPRPPSPPAPPRIWPFKGVYYGWAIPFSALLTSFASALMFGPVLGVFVKPIGDDLGWSRATIALAFTVGTFAGTILPAVIGAFLDRHGARGVIVVSGIIVSGCTIGLALMTQPWHFWTFYGVGRGVAVAGVQFGTTVAIANWFIKKRGRAMAIGGSGLRLGQTTLPLTRLSPPRDSPPPVRTALSGAEGAFISPVLQQSDPGPRSHVPSESSGKLSVRFAFGRSVGAIRFGFLAVVTGLAILLEPFTENERDESNDRSDSDS
ncbi:MAG: MFS transporter [Chloroflexi bacterium]|nr:MFS transporter [Chloroflexota bacterium]